MTETTPRKPARTKEQRREHYRVLERLIDDGAATLALVQEHMRANGVSRRQAFRDLRVVRRRLVRQALRDLGGRPMAVYQTHKRLEHLYRLAVKDGNVRVALKVEQCRCKLLDLYPRPGPPPDPYAPGPLRPDLLPPKPATRPG